MLSLIWLPVKPIDYITVLGFSSLWYVENLARCGSNKSGSLCLMKHGSITQQGNHVCYQRQSAYPAFGLSPQLQLRLRIEKNNSTMDDLSMDHHCVVLNVVIPEVLLCDSYVCIFVVVLCVRMKRQANLLICFANIVCFALIKHMISWSFLRNDLKKVTSAKLTHLYSSMRIKNSLLTNYFTFN